MSAIVLLLTSTFTSPVLILLSMLVLLLPCSQSAVQLMNYLTTALLPEAHVANILRAYKMRYDEIAKDSRMQQVIIFKNHGGTAGASLEHPHSQLIGIPVISHQVRERFHEALRHYDEYGECVFCAIAASTQDDPLAEAVTVKRPPQFIQAEPGRARLRPVVEHQQRDSRRGSERQPTST